MLPAPHGLKTSLRSKSLKIEVHENVQENDFRTAKKLNETRYPNDDSRSMPLLSYAKWRRI